MNNSRSQKEESSVIKNQSMAALIFNQTIGIVALGALFFTFLFTDKGKNITTRFQITTQIVDWLKTKLATFDFMDILLGITVVLIMVGWNLFQQLFVTQKMISKSEFKPRTKMRKLGSIYLIFTTAFVEEIVFRGLIFPALSFYLFPIGGLLASSFLFGIIHFEKGIQGQLGAMVYGIILGCAILLGASLWVCIIAHGINNAIAFLVPRNVLQFKRLKQ